MASNMSSTWISPSLLITYFLLVASIAFGDDIQTPGEPTANLLCISECGTCPVICSPPQSTPPPESGKYPPLIPTPLPPTPPTPPLLTPSTPLLLPPEAPIIEFSPPPSYHAHPPPPPPPPKTPPSSSAPLVTNPKSTHSPPNIPYVIVPGGPAPPLGQGNNYPYPYYYFYSNEASLSIPLNGFCFSLLMLLLIHVFCSCSRV